jgi:hypothetical protein
VLTLLSILVFAALIAYEFLISSQTWLRYMVYTYLGLIVVYSLWGLVQRSIRRVQFFPSTTSEAVMRQVSDQNRTVAADRYYSILGIINPRLQPGEMSDYSKRVEQVCQQLFIELLWWSFHSGPGTAVGLRCERDDFRTE